MERTREEMEAWYNSLPVPIYELMINWNKAMYDVMEAIKRDKKLGDVPSSVVLEHVMESAFTTREGAEAWYSSLPPHIFELVSRMNKARYDLTEALKQQTRIPTPPPLL